VVLLALKHTLFSKKGFYRQSYYSFAEVQPSHDILYLFVQQQFWYLHDWC